MVTDPDRRADPTAPRSGGRDCADGPTEPLPAAGRREELAEGLDRLRTRIAAACHRAGRDPGEVTLIAVTKTYPASDVLHLVGLGATDIGENRDREAAAKAAEVAGAGVRVRWHFIGTLQRNKCRSVVRYADMVHSVDSVRLARALGEAASRYRDRPLDVLLQVSLDGDSERGGAVPVWDADTDTALAVRAAVPVDRHLDRVAEAVTAEPQLRLRGVMAVAPIGWHPDNAFGRLAETMARLRLDYPTLDIMSAGMSADLEEAVAHGATHVRVGGALLGNRPPLG